jgi:beta-galactosidase
MRAFVFVILSCMFFSCTEQNAKADYFVKGVSNPVIILNGIWEINTSPSGEFWKMGADGAEWKDIKVPGECMMQGIPIKHDEPFVYKKRIKIPADFSDKEIVLQFDGVYSFARVWVNGTYVRDHSGGFTRWDCLITPFVTPGKEASIIVEVTDKADDISYGSGYAKHQIGGILRDVRLLALPPNHIEQLNIVTDLDENYKNAMLKISGSTNNKVENAQIKLKLKNTDDELVPLSNSLIELNNSALFKVENLVHSPEKWDAEHPNLYALTISYFENDKLLFEETKRVGFREVVVQGNKLLVNGMEVKLRGACRHDIHPLLGRVSAPDYELLDVQLAKESNMNFIRTSHYPPTENFLRLCDEYGLYIESETAVCFVGSHRTKDYQPGASESDPEFTERYLSQLKEMVDAQQNHPSIIMWSVGNENNYGVNFKKSYDWAKANDATRPVLFSYPGNVPENEKAYDILSMHYPGITGDMEQHEIKTHAFGYKEMPVIFDEWAHVACYNPFTIKEDPNIRSFWGQSLDSMWTKTFDADGGLGGAIWGMIDETFMLPESLPGFNQWWGKIDKNIIPYNYSGQTIGYGEWGIIDTWRRKKPEFWNTKKAYSPVKILRTVFEMPTGNVLDVPVYNRFDHTNFDELTFKIKQNNNAGILATLSLEPHTRGILSVPLDGLDAAEEMIIEIHDASNNLVDCYGLRIKSDKHVEIEKRPLEEIRLIENENDITIVCENESRVVFDKSTGLITKIQSSNDTLALSGPFLNLRTKGKSLMYSFHNIDDYGTNWKLKDFSFEQKKDMVAIFINGKTKNISSVKYKVIIHANGKIVCNYDVKNIPQEFIREIGLRFELPNEIDSLSWKRNGYWSFYSAGHLSAHKGRVSLYSDVQSTYRNSPEKQWQFDAKSFYYDGTKDELNGEQLTHIAKSTKENIREYNLFGEGKKKFSVLGSGDVSCRIAKDGDKIQLYANNKMDYVDLSWGNYQRNLKLEKKYSDEIIVQINTGN